MQHRQIGVVTLFPANQNPTKSVQPAMGTLHDPASSLETSLLPDRSGFFATAADVRRKAKRLDQCSNLVVVIAFVQAHSLRGALCRRRSSGRKGFERRTHQLHVMTVGSVDGHSQRNALGIGQQAALDALLAAIRRVGTRFFEPARGALVMAPSIASHDQSI